MFPVPFEPQVHRIHEVPFSAFLRRELQDPLVFVYRHERTKKWLVAAFLDPNKRKLMELVVLDGEERPVMTSAHVRELKGMRVGDAAVDRVNREFRHHLMYTDKHMNQSRQDDQQEEFEIRKFIRRRMIASRQGAPEFNGIDWKPNLII